MRRAPAATPRSRPEARPKKLTRRSASPSGNVFRMMASVSRAGMTCRRADGASLSARHNIHREQKRIKFFITRFPASQLFAPLSRAKPAPAGEISPRALTFLTIERDAPERAPSKAENGKDQ